MSNDLIADIQDLFQGLEGTPLAQMEEFAGLQEILGGLGDLGEGDLAGLAELFQQAQAEMQRFQDGGGVPTTGSDEDAINAALDAIMEDIVGFAFGMMMQNMSETQKMVNEAAQL